MAGEFPQLETERLALRLLPPDDADAVFAHFADEEVARYETADPARNLDDVVEIVDWGLNLLMWKAGVLWGILSKEDGSFLGQVNYLIRKGDNFTGTAHRAEIGYDLARHAGARAMPQKPFGASFRILLVPGQSTGLKHWSIPRMSAL